MADGSGRASVEQLRAAERERFLELREAIASCRTTPLRAVRAAAAIFRRLWFVGMCRLRDEVNRLSAIELELREFLYFKYLYPLFDSTDAEKLAATRRMNFEFERRRALVRAKRLAIVALWEIGGLTEKTWRWLATHRPIRIIDVSWRATIISLSTLTLLGFALFTVLDLQVAELPSAPAREQSSLPAPADPPVWSSSRMAFPTGPLPVFWEFDSSTSLLVGFDRNKGDFSELAVATDVCSAAAVFAYGASSLQGSVSRNKDIARDRSLALADHLLSATDACIQRPRIFAVAMSQPREEVDDGSQRKIFAVGVYGVSLTAASSAELSQLAGDGIDPALGVAPERYGVVELCAVPEGDETCTWQRLDQTGA